ncbi:MAG TPA: type IV secretion system DNA-binding domain-containing protein [Candidatus Saccharimonadales bacterium]|nr:type IV secretion system DNA-binding domain-containing protein [Candidatus Saccharimonadales bacterium]
MRLAMFGLLAAAPLVILTAVGWALRRRAAGEPRVLLDLLPPDGAAANLRSWSDFFEALYAISTPRWKSWLFGQPYLSFELWAGEESVRVRCWLPARLQTLVTTQIRSALPGLEVREAESDPELSAIAARSRLRLYRDPLYPLGNPRPEPLIAVVNALAFASQGVIQLVLQPEVGWQSQACRRLDVLGGVSPAPFTIKSFLVGTLDFLFGLVLPNPAPQPARPKPSHSNPLPPADKAAQPGYRAELRLRVSGSTTAEAKTRIHSLVAAYRRFDGANVLRPKRVWWGSHFDRVLLARRAPGTRADVLVPEELAGLFHLPVATDAIEVAPVRVAPPRLKPADGKVLCLTEGSTPVPVMIAQADCRQHLHLDGGTGSGKSTVMANLALQDIEARRGIAVIDLKGDLVRDLLARIPSQHWDRVVLIDPSFRDRPVGLNVLECDDPEQIEVVCDQIVTIFKKAYDRFWGPRTDDILRAALLTLLQHPGSTLCEVPLLLLYPAARAEMTKRLADPVGLEPFWEEYGRMAEGQRLQTVGPVLNKLRSVLLRRTVRNMLGQARSTVRLGEAMDSGGILLISLAKGLLGEETSQLLGSFMVARLWQAAMARAARPEAQRPDFNLYLDEFHSYLHLPQSLDEVLVEARSYHMGLVLANQHMGQLAASTRDALSANARTRVIFQCGQEDARYLAREFEPWLGELQLRNLQRFQVAVRLCRNGRTERPFTATTLPLPPALGDGHAERLIEAALERCGRSRQQVERAIERRFQAYRPGPPPRRP